MEWMALLAALAVKPELGLQKRVACELAPTIGQGASTEGAVDSISTLMASCSYRLLDVGGFSLWPRLSVAEQDWIIQRQVNQNSEIYNFQARSLVLGFQTSYPLADWEPYYGYAYGFGRGELNQTFSSSTSRQTNVFKDISHKYQQHELGLKYRLSSQLSLSASLLRTFASQAWDSEQGRFEAETVDSDSRLSLSSGSARLLGSPRSDAKFASSELKIGLQLFLD